MTKTITAAKERARKTSITVFGGPTSLRKNSENNFGRSNTGSRHQIEYGHDNNNFVIDVTDSTEGISEIERNVKIRMQKRDEMMR